MYRVCHHMQCARTHDGYTLLSDQEPACLHPYMYIEQHSSHMVVLHVDCTYHTHYTRRVHGTVGRV